MAGRASSGSGISSGPHSRFPAERIISDATGGMVPADGSVLIRRNGLWVFRSLAECIADTEQFYTKTEVDALIGGDLS